MIRTVAVVGTGLIGASVGLALRAAGFAGEIVGIDTNPAGLATASRLNAVSRVANNAQDEMLALQQSELILLAVPVLGILDWMTKLSSIAKPGQLITDVGSTKGVISAHGQRLFNQGHTAHFLPGHPMAGKESGGAALADAALFEGAAWLMTPIAPSNALTDEWRAWTGRLGARVMDLDSAQHDKLCAWVSHMPQMVATAMAALFEDEFGTSEDIRAVGGRALREMTRLGASPYSMWRDVAMTNTDAVAATLFALEQRLAHMRENLKTPELREEFAKANRFRAPK